MRILVRIAFHKLENCTSAVVFRQ